MRKINRLGLTALTAGMFLMPTGCNEPQNPVSVIREAPPAIVPAPQKPIQSIKRIEYTKPFDVIQVRRYEKFGSITHGDFNGDGCDDMAIATSESFDAPHCICVYVVYGKKTEAEKEQK